MPALCPVAKAPQMTCCPNTCRCVGKIFKMLAWHPAKNVVPTSQKTCRQDISQDFANMLADSFRHKEKTTKLCRKLCRYGAIWCKNVTNMPSNALIHAYIPLFSKKTTIISIGVLAHESWIWLGSLALTCQPTHDPAPNPVTVLATFDIGQFLVDNVSIMVICTNMSLTFPTKLM